ncbi:MAG: YceI family protein, partial [Candidatus Neomarinimicrobiota bacterium]|nr:YceI family protein [Candidatus Neomarinimicrobiota bacterium]
MKINKKAFIINFVVLCIISCGGKEKTANQTEKLKDDNNVALLVFDAGNYVAESDSSSVFWGCRWLGGSKHDGDVYLEQGSVYIKDDGNISGNFLVDMNTIDCFDIKNIGTKNKLIGHLKSDAFFDVENHPKARLEIHSSENIDANKFLFKGSLTIKSITNPIEMKGKVQKFDSGYSADIKLVFDRSKYDV